MSAEDIYARGQIFELVHTTQPDGRVFEMARRAPGVRVIVADRAAKNVLLQREFRRELDGYDFRLPGGKVFDTLETFDAFRQTGKDIIVAAAEKAKAEAREEAGVAIEEVTFFKRSTLGATVEWDLLVFEATKWKMHEAGQALEDGEQIDAPSWFAYGDVERMILRGDLHEDRIALILLQWINEQKA